METDLTKMSDEEFEKLCKSTKKQIIEKLENFYQEMWFKTEIESIKQKIEKLSIQYPITNGESLENTIELLGEKTNNRYIFEYNEKIDIVHISNVDDLCNFLVENRIIQRVKNGENILIPESTKLNEKNRGENNRAATVVLDIINFLDKNGLSYTNLSMQIDNNPLSSLIGTWIHLEWLKNAIENQGGYPIDTDQCLQYCNLSGTLQGEDTVHTSTRAMSIFTNKNRIDSLVEDLLDVPGDVKKSIKEANTSVFYNSLRKIFPNFTNDEKSINMAEETLDKVQGLLLEKQKEELEFICVYTTNLSFPEGIDKNDRLNYLSRSYNSLCPPNGKIYETLLNRVKNNNMTEEEMREHMKNYQDKLKDSIDLAKCSLQGVLNFAYTEQQIEELAAAEVRKRMLDEYDREYLEDGVTNISRSK